MGLRLPTPSIRAIDVRSARAILAAVAAAAALSLFSTFAMAQTDSTQTDSTRTQTPPASAPAPAATPQPTFAPESSAPTSAPGEPRYYGGAHLLFSNANVSAGRDYDPRFGIGGGIYVAGTVWKNFDLRIGADYIQKGANLSVGHWSVEWQFDYIEVPVLAVYNFMPRSRTSFEINAGIAYGFSIQQQLEEGGNLGYDLQPLLGQRIPVEHNPVSVGGELVPRSSIIVNQVETTDLSIVLGFGLSVPIGAVNVCFDARYEKGLTDPIVSATFEQVIGEGNAARIESTSEDLSNKTFCFFVGFEFPFGTRNPVQ